MLRRTLVKGLLASGLLPVMLWLPKRAAAAAWLTGAFEANQTQAVLDALHADAIQSQPAIIMDAPQKAENGAVVQVAIELPGPAGKLQQLAVIADANPTPLVTQLTVADTVYPKFVTRIKLAQSGAVIALAKDRQGQFTQQRRQVVVLEDGCASNERDEPFASSMKLRAKPLDAQGAVPALVELKIIILHPMRTGRGKDDAGQKLPAHFMQQMQVTHNGQRIIDAQTGTAIARNPYFTFYLTQAKVGDVISVTWQDNLGYSGQGEIKVST